MSEFARVEMAPRVGDQAVSVRLSAVGRIPYERQYVMRSNPR